MGASSAAFPLSGAIIPQDEGLDEFQAASGTAKEDGEDGSGSEEVPAAASEPAGANKGKSKSERSREDAAALLGVGTTNPAMRVLASIGEISSAPTEFRCPCEDVSYGGVLLALPALLASGLLRHASRFFSLPAGYYGLEHIFILLGFLALCRIRSIEQLRYTAPGEWGKLLGLDRCPEAKTLRNKIKLLTTQGDAEGWAAELCHDWMEERPEATGTLYIDGHARVYHGEQTKLPRHYIARQRLCLRATTDYWVHGLDGLPFFKINQAVDPGLIQVLEEQIVPQLEERIPDQPSPAELEADALRMRFRLIFDREGYSPGLFKRMKEKRIASQTYHKFPGADWPESEFFPRQVPLSDGGCAEMRLAERGTFLGSKKHEQLWVREIRKLTGSGHQVSIISTDWKASVEQIVAPQFGRWYQENFFKYGREHFNLDRLIDYQLEAVDETTRVVNPAWRKLDSDIRKRVAILSRNKARLYGLQLKGRVNAAKAEAYINRAETLRSTIEKEDSAIVRLKERRKEAGKHIPVSQLPEEEKWLKLATRSKHFIDTIKIVAYRAETAMASVVRERLNDHHRDEARALVRDICTTEADLIPDQKAKTLTVKLHSLATPKQNTVLAHLCEELNATVTTYPGTNLRMIFKPVSA